MEYACKAPEWNDYRTRPKIVVQCREGDRMRIWAHPVTARR